MKTNLRYIRVVLFFLFLSVVYSSLHAQNYSISTVAGTGTGRFFGNEGPAIEAQIDNVYDIEFDSYGNTYLYSGDMIRKIEKDTGEISVLFGDADSGHFDEGIAKFNFPFDFPFEFASF